MAKNDLYDKLSKTHIDYEEWRDEWKKYSDVMGDKTPINKTEYLPKGKHENESLYKLRVQLAEFIPESPLAIEKIIGALFHDTPNRELSPYLSDFSQNVTLRNDTMDSFAKKIVFKLLGYGSTRVLVNVRYPENIDRPLSVAEEQKYGVAPYLVNYSPDDVVDWSVDELGNLEMLRIKEIKNIWDKVAMEHKTLHRFIQYNKEQVQWWTFEKIRDKWELLPKRSGDRMHNLGRIPMVTKSLWEIKPMIGKSFIRYSALADIQKFRAESDMIYDTYIHAHPTLKVWAEESLSKIGVGTNTYIKLNPQEPREDAEYINFPASAFDAAERIAADRRNAVYRQAKTDPLGIIDQNPMQASGVARAWSFGTSEARMLTNLSTLMEDIENEIFEIVAAYRGEEFDGTIKYPTEFDLSSLDQLITDTERISQQVQSPTLIKLLHKRIAAAKTGSADAQQLEIIYDEIDNSSLTAGPPEPEEIGELGDQDLNEE